MSEETPPGDIEPGTELGGYRFTRLLGRGGMGAVYEAQQLSLERSVALKVISPELSSSESFRARFAQEARVAASLDHPAVLPVYETGQLPDARLFIAMRLVHGIDFETKLRAEGRLAPVEAMEILAQVGEALDAAHAAGVIHGDARVSLPAAEDLDAVVESVCTEAGLLDRVDEVREMAVRCLASETVKRGIASGMWRREVPFTVEQDGGYATGRVDAVYEESGDLVIVDFKSDDVSGDEAAHEAFTLRHHGGQADAYAGALGRASGRTVAGVSFVYGRTSAEVWVQRGRAAS